jgi:shikimate dehydrogenase
VTGRVGIIGFPLGHSISPAFQQAAFDELGLDCAYERWPTPSDELEARIQSLRGPEVLGANVTVPHKQAVISLVDEIDPIASRIGAINTIVRNVNGTLRGHNTDAEGFIRSLRADTGFDPAGRAVVILGAGGAARAVAFGLADAGIKRITILNRTKEKAMELADAVARAASIRVTGASPGPESALNGDPAPDLIVQCTSIGMSGGSEEGKAPEISGLISDGTLVCDLVYNPIVTPLLRLAAARGARTLGGLSMLVHQGAAAFTLWTGRDAPTEVMERAAHRALGPDADQLNTD